MSLNTKNVKLCFANLVCLFCLGTADCCQNPHNMQCITERDAAHLHLFSFSQVCFSDVNSYFIFQNSRYNKLISLHRHSRSNMLKEQNALLLYMFGRNLKMRNRFKYRHWHINLLRFLRKLQTEFDANSNAIIERKMSVENAYKL